MNSQSRVRWPDLFIVGAAKSGTSSLAYYISQHPDVEMCQQKEPNYFALANMDLHRMNGPASGDTLYKRLYTGSVTSTVDYLKLFSDLSQNALIAEASVRYLYSDKAASLIHSVVPNAKIVIILREPARRAWSHYGMMKYLFNLEPLTWHAALIAESSRISAGWDFDWHYRCVGMYAPQVKRYVDLFGHDQVKIYWHNEFALSPETVLHDIFCFSGLDPSFMPDVSKSEKSGFMTRYAPLEQIINSRLGYYTPNFSTLRHKDKCLAYLRNANRRPLPPPPVKWIEWFEEPSYVDKKELEKIIGLKAPW